MATTVTKDPDELDVEVADDDILGPVRDDGHDDEQAAIVAIAIQFFINMEVERYTLATGETAIIGFTRLSAASPRTRSRSTRRPTVPRGRRDRLHPAALGRMTKPLRLRLLLAVSIWLLLISLVKLVELVA
jgi:hypothetical protein